jgi:hypothetical protein
VSLELADIDSGWPANAQVTSFALMRSRLAPFDLLFERLPSLRHLRLAHVRMSDRMAFELSAQPELARITRLDLSHNELTSDGARVIAKSPHAQNLIELRLTGNSLDEATRTALHDLLPQTELIT